MNTNISGIHAGSRDVKTALHEVSTSLLSCLSAAHPAFYRAFRSVFRRTFHSASRRTFPPFSVFSFPAVIPVFTVIPFFTVFTVFLLFAAGIPAYGETLPAVNAALDADRVQVVEHTQFPSGKGVALKPDVLENENPWTSDSASASADIVFRTEIKEPGLYRFWATAAVEGATKEKLRVSHSKMDSVPVKLSVNGGLISSRYVVEPWRDLENCTCRLGLFRFQEAGPVTVRVWLPKDLILEQMQLSLYTPPKSPEEVYSYAPSIAPPAGVHPRILVTPEQLPALRENMKAEENVPVWDYVRTKAERPFTLELPEGRTVEHNSRLLAAIQAKAFAFLITEDKTFGRDAISLMVPYMQRVEYGNLLDITREIGSTIYTASLVYDWCFPLLEPQEKEALEVNMLRLADSMECGWPPFGEPIVNGHGAEGQILQHLLTMAVALYDVNPEPYRWCSWLLFEQLIPLRACEYESPRHNQGINYGNYRIQFEYFAALLVERMSGKRVFNENFCRMPLYFLNMRLPDGTAIPDGDCYSRGVLLYPPTIRLMRAYCRAPELQPLLKAEEMRQKGTRTIPEDPVMFLLVNDPTVKPDFSFKSLPLAFDSGSRLASLILRTGWMSDSFMRDGKTMEPDASDVVVELKGGGYNALNHQHFDAGAFQIYSHGWLTRDLGVYHFYGLPYDMKFNKASASHNVLLIRGPNPNPDGRDDGGQMRPSTFPRTPEQILNDAQFQTGTVLETVMEPSAENPKYVRYSVNLTPAYADRVESYVRTFQWQRLMPEEAPGVPVILTVSDRVRLKDAGSRCYWQLNTFRKPEVQLDGTLLADGVPALNASHAPSRLAVTMLLPESVNRELELIGGERENSVFELQYSTPMDLPETHGWRAVYSAKTGEKEVQFFSVIQVLEDGASPLPMEKIPQNLMKR